MELLLQLLGTEHKVPLGDRKLTYADQTVHLAAFLVAEQRRGLTKAHRQLAIGTLFI